MKKKTKPPRTGSRKAAQDMARQLLAGDPAYYYPVFLNRLTKDQLTDLVLKTRRELIETRTGLKSATVKGMQAARDLELYKQLATARGEVIDLRDKLKANQEPDCPFD